MVPEQFKSILDWCINNFAYKAPEQESECWYMLSNIIHHKIFQGNLYLTEEWQLLVVSILTNKSINEIKQINEQYKPKVSDVQ